MAQRKAIQKPGLLSSPYLAKEHEPPGGAKSASVHGPGYGPGYEPGYGPRGELALIELIRKRAARIKPSAKGKAQIQMGIGDDCALLRPRAGHELAVTTDLSIEGRHFRLDWHPPESIGHRALARGLSDLAAMGARPVAAFLSLALPRDLTVQFEDLGWMERFLDGLLSLAARYNVPLAGGDLAESPLALADVVLTGSVPQGKALLRSGAKPGDLIYVTGSLGGSAAQLAAMSTPTFVTVDETGMDGMFTHGDEPHFYPEPRIAQGLWLRKQGVASAAMDISDGLSTDLAHLVKGSAVAAEIVAERIPLGRNATLAMALHGGEDYELLFTAPAERKLPRKIAGVAVTQIGRILPWKRKQPRVTLIGAEGSEALEPLGWEHFSDKA